MKKYIIYAASLMVSSLITLTSCGDDFLTAEATEGAILSSLGSAYQILLFDSYANNNYNSILLMSDLRSDDIYKGGGDAGDQSALYSLSQFKISPSESLGGLWSIYFTGLARCNNVIIACNNAVGVLDAKKTQYKDRKSTRLNSSHQIISYA